MESGAGTSQSHVVKCHHINRTTAMFPAQPTEPLVNIWHTLWASAAVLSFSNSVLMSQVLSLLLLN